MVVVAKPEKIRICLDPQDLNKAFLKPKYQMPTLGRNITQSHKCENVYNTRSEGWTLSDWPWQKGSIKSAWFCPLFGKIYAEVI